SRGGADELSSALADAGAGIRAMDSDRGESDRTQRRAGARGLRSYRSLVWSSRECLPINHAPAEPAGDGGLAPGPEAAGLGRDPDGEDRPGTARSGRGNLSRELRGLPQHGAL